MLILMDVCIILIQIAMIVSQILAATMGPV
jgi:hypothetical protein